MSNTQSRLRRIDQVLVTASPGDAITSMAMTLRTILRGHYLSDIYALTVLPELAGDVLPLTRLGPDVPTSQLVYHSSFGEPEITALLCERRQKISMVFHNFTPHKYFERHSARFATGLLWGEHELERLREKLDVVIADSEFNAAFLGQRGFRDVIVLPMGVEVGRLQGLRGNRQTECDLKNRFRDGYVAVVAQQLPHKRIELAISTLSVLRHTFEHDIGLVVVGAERVPSYSNALRVFAERLRVENSVHFTGSISDNSLASVLRSAHCLLLTSDHEGLGIPPLEAMTMRVPVIARHVGAVKETLKDGALVLPGDSGPCAFASAVNLLLGPNNLREMLLTKGLARVREFQSEDRSTEIAEILAGAVI